MANAKTKLKRTKTSYQRKKVLSAYNQALAKAGGRKTKKGAQIIKSYGGPRKIKRKK